MAEKGSTGVEMTAISQSREPLNARFDRLAQQWKRDTAFTSSHSKIYGYPAYQEIISMGEPAVRLVLAALEQRPDHWFAALQALTGENPVAPGDEGDIILSLDSMAVIPLWPRGTFAF
jgi:hypothetical protein